MAEPAPAPAPAPARTPLEADPNSLNIGIVEVEEGRQPGEVYIQFDRSLSLVTFTPAQACLVARSLLRVAGMVDPAND